eukprot:320552-Chlamydomonas_euryale.AAC.24
MRMRVKLGEGFAHAFAKRTCNMCLNSTRFCARQYACSSLEAAFHGWQAVTASHSWQQPHAAWPLLYFRRINM